MEGSLKWLLKKNGSCYKAVRTFWAHEKFRLTKVVALLEKQEAFLVAGGNLSRGKKCLESTNGELRTRLKMVGNRLRFVRRANVLLKEEKASSDHARLA